MKSVVLHEVGPRDGLQVEKEPVALETKIRWIETILSSGIDVVQLGSFVNPLKVPQMADTDALFRYFSQPGHKPEKTVLSGLVLNEKGLDRGMACGVDLFCMGVSASDTHSRRNTGMSTDEALPRIIAMGQNAIAAGKGVQVSVQSAFGCGYEGPVAEERVLSIVRAYVDAGLDRISLADTAGHAQPWQVERLFWAVRDIAPMAELACHFHDTYGMALANCYAAARCGVVWFESAVGGMGGCPFTAVAAGNVATEDLVHMFQSKGLRYEINLDPLIAAARNAESFLRHDLPGVIHRTGPIPKQEMAAAQP